MMRKNPDPLPRAPRRSIRIVVDLPDEHEPGLLLTIYVDPALRALLVAQLDALWRPEWSGKLDTIKINGQPWLPTKKRESREGMRALADDPPVFPCWLWQDGYYCGTNKPGWIRFIEPVNELVLGHCTHWHEDQPGSPEVSPGATA